MKIGTFALATLGLAALLAAPAAAANWTGGSIHLTWELAPPDAVPKGEAFAATVACNYDANMAPNIQWAFGSLHVGFEWEFLTDQKVHGPNTPALGQDGGGPTSPAGTSRTPMPAAKPSRSGRT